MWFNPLCVRCLEQSKLITAKVTDHIIPAIQNGILDMILFWDRSNHQSLCIPCHNSKTATEDGAFGRSKKKRDLQKVVPL